MAQDLLTEAIPARSYTGGSTLNLARAALFGVPPSKVESIVELLKSYRGGKPNSLIMGGPMGWSWHATLDTTHHGSLAGPADAHRHSDLANIGIDNHHARDHVARHHSGGADALALGSIAGNLTDAQHGSRTVANAHAHSHLSGIGANDHHNRSHDHSLAADGTPIAVAGVPNLPASKITSGRFGMPRMPDGTSGQVLTAQGAGVDPAYAAVPAVPSGLIAMWHGLIANIPSGWVICDGNNSTPNLLARFIEGVATAATNPGTTGGATSKTSLNHRHNFSDVGGETYRVLTTPGDAQLDINTSYTSSGGRVSSMVTNATATITDIRPLFYDIAYLMKT